MSSMKWFIVIVSLLFVKYAILGERYVTDYLCAVQYHRANWERIRTHIEIVQHRNPPTHEYDSLIGESSANGSPYVVWGKSR